MKPTTLRYNGVLYRTHLHRKWAAFFNYLGWLDSRVVYDPYGDGVVTFALAQPKKVGTTWPLVVTESLVPAEFVEEAARADLPDWAIVLGVTPLPLLGPDGTLGDGQPAWAGMTTWDETSRGYERAVWTWSTDDGLGLDVPAFPAVREAARAREVVREAWTKGTNDIVSHQRHADAEARRAGARR